MLGMVLFLIIPGPLIYSWSKKDLGAPVRGSSGDVMEEYYKERNSRVNIIWQSFIESKSILAQMVPMITRKYHESMV